MSSDKGAKCANYDWRCLTRAWKVGGVGRAHSWAKSQKPAKNEIQKIREIDESYLCLQRFDKFWMWSAGNRKRKLCEFAETSMEKLVKSPWANLCFGGFLTFGTTVGQRGSCWHGFTKKNLKWHICITNDDSYCAHGHTRTNRCVNGYICMYVCM